MDIPWIVSTVNILNIVSDINAFKQWLLEFHGIDVTRDSKAGTEILQGYKFFFDTAFRALLYDLARVNWFGKDDIILQRAVFVGVSLNELPNSCDRILLLKNLWYKYFEKVLKAKNWTDLEKRLEILQNQVISKFFELFSCWIVPRRRHSLKDIYQFWSLNDALIRYTDTSRRRPMPYYDLLLPISGKYYDDKNYMDRVFRGYAYTLQFLWYRLLGREVFRRILNLDRMHIADQVFPRENKWLALDEFFSILHPVISKVEQQVGVSFGISDHLLYDLNPKCRPMNVLNGLYSPKVPEPKYPPTTDSYKEWKRWLDLKFLWYPLDVLDTFGSHAFNGVISFLYMVRGIGESKRDQNAYPTRVLRIKHPEGPGNRISYGILVEGYGLISDYSGWIVFYELGTDFSGTGGSWFRAAESILEQYKDVFEVEEITVAGEIFEKYLADKVPDRFSEDIWMKFESIEGDNLKYQETIESLERLMADFRGILPELLVYYLVSAGRLYSESESTKEWKKVEWNIKVGGEQIDVFAVDDTNRPWIFECKFDVHHEEVEDTINQILRKRSAILNEYKVEPITNLVFLRNRNNYPLALFEDKGIHVVVLEPILRRLLPEKNLDVIRRIIKGE